MFITHVFTYPIAFSELYTVTGGFSGQDNWAHLAMYTEIYTTSRLEQVVIGSSNTLDNRGTANGAYYIAIGR